MAERIVEFRCDGDVGEDGRTVLTITATNLTMDEAQEIAARVAAPFREIVHDVVLGRTRGKIRLETVKASHQ